MANFNFNKVIIGGRLTNDPELKTTQSGISVVSVRIAVNRRANGNEPTVDFFVVNAWRKTAEFISTYFRKGSSICVSGSLRNREWKNQEGNTVRVTEIEADEAFFVDSKSEMPQAREQEPHKEPEIPANFEAVATDELPF